MSAKLLLSDLRRRGYALRADSGTLYVTGERLGADECALVTAHKPALLALLAEERAAAEASWGRHLATFDDSGTNTLAHGLVRLGIVREDKTDGNDVQELRGPDPVGHDGDRPQDAARP